MGFTACCDNWHARTKMLSNLIQHIAEWCSIHWHDRHRMLNIERLLLAVSCPSISLFLDDLNVRYW